MKVLKTMLGLVAIAMIGTSITACSNDSESRVNSANADLDRMKAIELELAHKGFLIQRPELSGEAIRRSDPGQLDQVEALLNEFLSHAQNAHDVSNRDDVKRDDDLRGQIDRRIEGARQLKRLIRDGSFRGDDRDYHEEPVILHSPKHRRRK